MTEDYGVQICQPSSLSEPDLAKCIALIQGGRAIEDPQSVARELPRVEMLAVLRNAEDIVGVGAIKRIRRGYAAGRATASGHAFPSDLQELGYVVVAPAHQGKRLSSRIVAALVEKHSGLLWATTDDDRMKRVLSRSGFERKGKEWQGHRGQLSLWLTKSQPGQP